jgi:hypothetical protein
MKYFLSDIAGTVYEIVTGQSFTQRLIRRKIGNVFRRLRGEAPRRSWEDGRVNKPSVEECQRLNDEAGRSV